MKSDKQITTPDEIKQLTAELQKSIDLASSSLENLSQIRLKLTLDFSADCKECGTHAGFIKDCRDRLLINQLKDLAAFITAQTKLLYVINIDSNQLNSAALKANEEHADQHSNTNNNN